MTLPDFIPPMLAAPGELFESRDHLYEPKWDGIRCLAFAAHPVRLVSRNGNDITPQFPEMARLAACMKGTGWILDGELLVLGADGKPDFDLVRNRNLLRDPVRIRHSAVSAPAVLMVFDLLYLDEQPLLSQPLRERRRLLVEQLAPADIVQLTPALTGGGAAFHRAVVAGGMEGTVIKDPDRPYLPGQRSRYWTKVRHVSTADCVIGGFTNKGTFFGSLLVGQYWRGDLLYVGHVGTGFSQEVNALITQTLKRIEVPRPYFASVPSDAARNATWVQPVVVCEVEYLRWTKDGYLRHPVFRGVRVDKDPAACLLNSDHPLHGGAE